VVEPTDAIMPIIQRIQEDIAGVKVDIGGLKGDVADIRRVQDAHGRRLNEIVSVLSYHTQRLNEIDGHMAFSLSIVSRHTGENEAVRAELDAIKRRLARLEAQT